MESEVKRKYMQMEAKKTAETLMLVSDKIDFHKYKKRPRKSLYADKRVNSPRG